MESSFEIFDAAIRQALKKYYNHTHYDDMYQECYLKILEVLSNNTYDPVYNLYGYAYTIARNTISSYRYHNEKLTTLAEDDLVAVWDPPSGEDISSNIYIKEAAEEVLNRFKSLLPDNFTAQNIIDLLSTESDPDSLVLTVVKGDYVWTLSSYTKRR